MDAAGHFYRDLWLQPTLELEGQKLGNLYGTRAANSLSEGLATTDFVRYLGLNDCGLGDQGIILLMEGLKENHSIEILDLTNNAIKDGGAIAIGSALLVQCSLQSILLVDNKIRKVGGEAIAAALKTNVKLRKLNLSGNRLRDSGAKAIADVLSCENKTLRMLNLSANEINEEGAQALAQMVSSNIGLQALLLGRNLIGNALSHFGPALSSNTTLIELDLQNNIITSASAQLFCESLVQLSVRTINLGDNKDLGNQGLHSFVECLKNHSAVRYLDLSNVGITGKIMGEVSSLLEFCPHLETLQLDNNRIGSEGILLLSAMMKDYHSLTSLNVASCGVDSSAVVALALALHSNPLFSSLTISGNKITDNACRSLCFALKRFTCLHTLDLADNSITSAVKEELASIFVNNPSLGTIFLSHNPISETLVNGMLSRRTAVGILENAQDLGSLIVPPLSSVPASVANGQASSYSNPSSSYLPCLPSSPSAVAQGFDIQSSSAAKSALVRRCMDLTTQSTKRSAAANPSANSSFAVALRSTNSSNNNSQTQKNSNQMAFVANGTYPPLIPSKISLEHPYYPGFGRGRFSNSCLIQTPDDPISYTIANSRGSSLHHKWNDRISTSDAMFGAPLRRVHRLNPYSERQLEANIGGLLVTENQLRKAFSELDVDGNGWLDRDEFEQLFHTFENFGIHPSDKKVKDVVTRYKMMDDGRITFDEFSLLMLTLAQR